MFSSSSITTSNISISQHKNAFVIAKKNLSSAGPHITISHGSKGITSTEIQLTDFFLGHDFTVTLVDHFSPLGIQELLWIPQPEVTALQSISLQDLIETLPPPLHTNSIHLGLSLGGYIGINALWPYKIICACYPAPLPMGKATLSRNSSCIYLFYGKSDNWTPPPPQLLNIIPQDQQFALEGAHHSFMSADKNKVFDVNRYSSLYFTVEDSELRQMGLDHESLAKWGDYESIVVHNKTCEKSKLFVLNKILELANE